VTSQPTNRESAATGKSDAALSAAPPGPEPLGRAPKKTPTAIHRGHCPSWARAEGDLLGSTRTLLIQRGHHNRSNSSNLQQFTRVRVTRCWSLLGFMLEFAVLYSLKC
jgi:hypothetical protein